MTRISKKDLLASLIFGRLNPFSSALQDGLKSKRLTVLGYHRVFPKQGRDYPFNEANISAFPEEFERQMEYVGKRYNVINFHILKKILESGGKIPENSLIVTFDDGYADNYRIAFPILRRLGLTATIFIATDFIDKGQTFWFERLTYQISRMPEQRLVLNSGSFEIDIKDGNRTKCRQRIIRLLHEVSNRDRLKILNELDGQTGIDVSDADRALADPLNWDQIREMDRAGIEIGSHTVTHPCLSQTTDEELRFEISESKRALEGKIGREIVSVSYPFGGKIHYDARAMRYAKECGYTFGVSYRHGSRVFDESIRFEIPRVHVETDISFNLFRGNLLMPGIFNHNNSGF